MKGSRYLKAAFLMPANLVALGASALATVVTGEPAVLLVALGAESLYLGALSSAATFRRAIRAQDLAENVDPEREASALFEELSPSQKEHYFALKGVRDRILENYRKLPGGRVLAAGSEQQVDQLLTSFIRLVSTLNHYRKFLGTSDRRQVEQELKELEADVAGEANPRLRDVKQRRVEIIRKRVERFQKAEESRELVSHQLAGLEDLLKLTHEQSIAIRDPESVGRALERLTLEAQSTEATVREMEQFLDATDEISGPPLPGGVRVR
ncbi:MAG TPA: hypothetical protein VND93_15185 [Myxococcales bacterium]|nr:hypothetical protein [Myxococcales bacterium]